MVLNTEPTGDVVFDLTSENTEEATLSSSSLTFSTGNWNSAQTVTITGVDDDEDDGDQTITITTAINATSTADSNYDSLADQTFTTAVVDNDTVGYVITESGGSTSVTEGGSSDSISVVLSSQPNTKVRITFTSADTGEVTVSSSALTLMLQTGTHHKISIFCQSRITKMMTIKRSRLPPQLIRDSPMMRNMMRLWINHLV